LRNGSLQDQGRPEQNEREHRDQRNAKRDEHEPIACRTVCSDPAVGHERRGPERRQAEEAQRGRSRGGEREIPLVEDERRILEEKAEKRAHFAPFYSSREHQVSRLELLKQKKTSKTN